MGQWKGGRRHGEGVLRGNNSDEYTGEWRDGVRCGAGVQRWGASGDVLVGTWMDDGLVGHGTLTSGKGDVYEGGFLASLQHGEGECRYADGSVYNGGWASGMYEGEGELIGPHSARCVGHWHAGEMVGTGCRVYEGGEEYRGEFARGLRHGRGSWHSTPLSTAHMGGLRSRHGTHLDRERPVGATLPLRRRRVPWRRRSG